MGKKHQERKGKRLIHIHLPEEVHKQLRIRVAELDTTMQDWVSALVKRELGVSGRRKRKK